MSYQQSSNLRIHEISQKLNTNLISEKELNELATLIYPKLKYFIFSFCKNEFDTCEATQYTLKKIFKNIQKYDISKGKFTTWIFRIAKNETLFYLFYKEKDKLFDIDNCSNHINSISSNDWNFSKDRKIDILDIDESNVLNDIYEKTVAEINNIQDKTLKDIAVSKMINNKKVKDIAIELNLNENTVKTKIRKIKMEIKRNITQKYPFMVEQLNSLL